MREIRYSFKNATKIMDAASTYLVAYIWIQIQNCDLLEDDFNSQIFVK